MKELHCATQLLAKFRSLIFVLFILGELFISCYTPLLIHTRMISMPPSDFPVSTHETIHCEISSPMALVSHCWARSQSVAHLLLSSKNQPWFPNYQLFRISSLTYEKVLSNPWIFVFCVVRPSKWLWSNWHNTILSPLKMWDFTSEVSQFIEAKVNPSHNELLSWCGQVFSNGFESWLWGRRKMQNRKHHSWKVICLGCPF